jgi:membrane-associated phospholipid phosphatase
LLPGEVGLTRWLSEHATGPAAWVAEFLDVAFTDAAAPIAFAAMVPLVWWAWGRYAAATFLVAGSLSGVTKVADLAARPRPTDDLAWGQVVHGEGGYPSGHVVYAVLVFGTLAFLAVRYMAPGWKRSSFIAAMVALVVISGPARLVQLDHWPADILASYLFALPLLGVVVFLHSRLLPWLARHLPSLWRFLVADGRASPLPAA